MSRIYSCIAGSLLITAVAALGCSNDSPQATTQPRGEVPEPAPPVPSFTISGIVFEHTPSGPRPAAGVAISVRFQGGVTAISDADGRYSASVRGDVVTIAPSESESYMSPCPSGTTWLSSNPNRPFDLHIVSNAVLSTSGMPDSYPITNIYVSGTVFEMMSDGPRPTAGALVTLGEDSTLSYSTTLTDTLGRYELCTAPPGVGTDQLMPLRVAKDGYSPESRYVLGGWETRDVRMELRRR
jgi:hypothetical protein